MRFSRCESISLFGLRLLWINFILSISCLTMRNYSDILPEVEKLVGGYQVGFGQAQFFLYLYFAERRVFVESLRMPRICPISHLLMRDSSGIPDGP